MKPSNETQRDSNNLIKKQKPKSKIKIKATDDPIAILPKISNAEAMDLPIWKKVHAECTKGLGS